MSDEGRALRFQEALSRLPREERFKATVYAMNTLLLKKGVYTIDEFEQLFCEHADNVLRATEGR